MLNDFEAVVAPVCRLTDGFNRAVVKRNTALIPLFKQIQHPLFNRRIGGNGFQTAEITAVAALAQRLHLNMPNFADVAVTANEDASVGDNPGACTTMDAHQNRVLAILTGAEVVFRQCRYEYRVPRNR